MKPTILLLAIVLLSGCSTCVVKEDRTAKVVVRKMEGVKTTSRHVYSWWKGDFVLQPDVKTVYYLVYSDKSHECVGIDTYATTMEGDTVFQTVKRNVCQ